MSYYINDFKEFFNEIIDENKKENVKVIISQFEKDKLCLFFVSNNKNYLYGHYGICDIKDENNSINICKYFKILKYLKSEYFIDVIFDWDWYLNL